MPPRARRPLGLSTLAIHGGAESGDKGATLPQPVVSTPIFQSANHFEHGVNADVVERRLAAMESAEAALMTSTGVAATALALLTLLRPGDHLLASTWIYGETKKLLTQEFDRVGIDVTLVDPMESRGWRKRLKKETRAIYLESPVNPTCRVIDLKPISLLTKELGLALVVDSTFASPINFRPIEHGADVVIQSTTEVLNGHHDAAGGVILGSEAVIEEARDKMKVWGQVPDAFSCWLLERGLKTLAVRVTRQNESALALAEWASKRKEIRRVHYPGLPSHEDHAVAEHHLEGFGAMIGIELSGGARAADRFVRRLALWINGPNFGGVDSVANEPRWTTHTEYTPEAMAKLGIPDGFVRLGTGLEDPDDLIADLEQALK
jgi:cystathionine beta-lyase/cystathionine gamma-synthase